MGTGPKGQWGGARPGSGQKPTTLSAESIQKLLKTARKWARKEKKDLDDVLFRIIYDEETPPQTRVLGIDLVKEYTMAKLEEGGENDRALAPAVYLPEERPDPGNVIPII
jgi:hypothetical protein